MDTPNGTDRWRRRLKPLIVNHYPELSYIAIVVVVHMTSLAGLDISLGPKTTPGRIQAYPWLTAVPVLIFTLGMIVLNQARLHRIRLAQVISWTYWVIGFTSTLVFDPGSGVLMCLAGGRVWRCFVTPRPHPQEPDGDP